VACLDVIGDNESGSGGMVVLGLYKLKPKHGFLVLNMHWLRENLFENFISNILLSQAL
jgi:hypothetical protein